MFSLLLLSLFGDASAAPYMWGVGVMTSTYMFLFDYPLALSKHMNDNNKLGNPRE
jgi:hypothetical protein